MVSVAALPMVGESLDDGAVAGRDAAGNIVITWARRTRVDGEWRDYADAGLGETLRVAHR